MQSIAMRRMLILAGQVAVSYAATYLDGRLVSAFKT
jgi:hypothetical protein